MPTSDIAAEPSARDRWATRASRLTGAPVVAAAVWAAVWAALTATGQAFPLRVLYAGYQFLPFDPLADDPIGSVWNLHIQPPLWNFVIGVVNGWSPVSPGVGHRLVAVALGSLTAAAVASTLVRLGASRRWAIGLSIFATVNTHVLVHAFEPRYDLAVAALTAGVVWSVARGLDDRARWVLAVPVVVATTLVALRALYHPIWLAAVIVIVAWSYRGRVGRRELLVSVVVPMVVVGGWMAKNAVEFDRFSMSSWTGMNLLRSTLPAVDPATVDALVADGTVSGLTEAGVFRSLADYQAAVPCEMDGPVDPVLGMENRRLPEEQRIGPFDGELVPNFNHVCYLDVYEQAGDDAAALIRREPRAWLRARLWAANNWFEAPGQRPYDPSPLWRPLDEASRAAWLAVPHPGLPAAWDDSRIWVHSTRISLVALVASAVCIGAGARSLRRWRQPSPEDAVRWVLGLTLMWTAVAGIGLELGEQGRFRNGIDPVVVALGAWWCVAYVRRRRSGAGTLSHVDRRP